MDISYMCNTEKHCIGGQTQWNSPKHETLGFTALVARIGEIVLHIYTFSALNIYFSNRFLLVVLCSFCLNFKPRPRVFFILRFCCEILLGKNVNGRTSDRCLDL